MPLPERKGAAPERKSCKYNALHAISVRKPVRADVFSGGGLGESVSGVAAIGLASSAAAFLAALSASTPPSDWDGVAGALGDGSFSGSAMMPKDLEVVAVPLETSPVAIGAGTFAVSTVEGFEPARPFIVESQRCLFLAIGSISDSAAHWSGSTAPSPLWHNT
jgi:hypothetical protein